MAMQKKGDSEKVEILRGREANVLHSHMERTGKTSLSRFSEDEMEELNRDLGEARKEEEAEQRELAAAMEEELPPRKLIKPVKPAPPADSSK